MGWQSMTGTDFDDTGELSQAIRAQRLHRSRRALNQMRSQLKKLQEMLPEGLVSELERDDLSLNQIDEALARFEEILAARERA